jgi:hypothetical protein
MVASAASSMVARAGETDGNDIKLHLGLTGDNAQKCFMEQ